MTTHVCNLNDRVLVELTPAGQKHYDDYVKRESEKFGTAPRAQQNLRHGTHMEFQLWDFINIFGDGSPHFNGGPVLFDSNRLIIEEIE